MSASVEWLDSERLAWNVDGQRIELSVEAERPASRAHVTRHALAHH